MGGGVAIAALTSAIAYIARTVQEVQLYKIALVLLLAFLAVIMPAVVLALIGGGIMSASVLRRVEQINVTTEQIMLGKLSERIPRRNTGDEFDQLAANLNRMLEEIETLLNGVRHVSDNIAHDLRTPLTRLRNLLEQAALEPDPQRDDRHRGRRAVRHRPDRPGGALRQAVRPRRGQAVQ